MKIWSIAWKDTLIRFRDRNALILMLAAPLILSLIIGSAFGGFISGNDPTPFDAIPVLFINQDEGALGDELLSILTTNEQLAELLAVTETADLSAARETVQRGDARAAVVIPPTFTSAIQGGLADTADETAVVQFYADPGATLTPNIVRGVLMQIINGFNSTGISGQVAIERLIQTEGLAVTQQFDTLLPLLNQAIEESVVAADGPTTAVSLNRISTADPTEEDLGDVSPFAYFAPSMGILFLMFSMMDGTRSILEEEKMGTLDRLVSTPTTHREILLGKIGGVFLTGMLQFVLFVIASRFLFNLNWGSSLLGLIMMTISIVLAFTSLGALIAAFAKDLSQAGIIGTVVTLIFAALGGTFVPAQNFPDWLEQASKLTITRWGMDGFSDLTLRGLGAEAVVLETAVLFGLGVLLFFLALFQFQRRIAR